MTTKATYTFNANGNLIGTDNFVVPANFSEFIERFPTLIDRFVRARTPDATEAERTEKVLCLKRWLLTPTAGQLTSDRIAAFQPERQPEVSATTFFRYLAICLSMAWYRAGWKFNAPGIADDPRYALMAAIERGIPYAPSLSASASV